MDESYRYIGKSAAEKIQRLVKEFADNDWSAENLLARLKEVLPLHRNEENSTLGRVEGLGIACDFLVEEVLAQKGRESLGWDREDVVSRAKIRPLSYYHEVTGSAGMEQEQAGGDYLFRDPTRSLVKLEDDVLALGRLLRGRSS